MKDYRNAARVLERWLVLHPGDERVKPLYEELKRSLQGGAPPAPADTLSPGSGPIGNER
jgi:hypothetical protein